MKNFLPLVVFFLLALNILLVYMFVFKGETKQANDGRTAIIMSEGNRDYAMSEMRMFLESLEGINEGVLEQNQQKIINAAKKSGTEKSEVAPQGLIKSLPIGFKTLGMSTHKMFDEIVKMNEGAVPFIKSYLQNSNTLSNSSELSVEVLYEVMLAKYKVSKNFNLYDEVVYKGKNTVEGTWVFQDIILETSYGRIKVARKNIESIDIKTMAAEGFSKDNSFKVFANRYVLGNKEEAWLNTGILVKKGQEIKITADGEISLASLSGNKYSPDGGVNGSPGPTDKKLNYGNLVFRISQNGTPIKAGDNLKITAERTGIIFISIYETVFNSANSGFYTANVRVK